MGKQRFFFVNNSDGKEENLFEQIPKLPSFLYSLEFPSSFAEGRSNACSEILTIVFTCLLCW